MSRGTRRTIARVGGLAALAAATAGVVFLALAPLGPALSSRYLAVWVGRQAVELFDPFQPPHRAPVCNCSTDWAYVCDDPSLDYYARIRQDDRVRRFYIEPRNDLETYLGYADFLRDRFPHGNHSRQLSHPEQVYSWNLLELLDETDAGESLVCGEIAKMLSQMIIAGGGFARVGGPRTKQIAGLGHLVVEAWIPERSKWIMIDPDNNVYFTDRTGEPLSLLDLHEIAVSGRFDDAVAHPGPSANSLYKPGRHRMLVEMHGWVGYRARADWVSADYPYLHPKRHPSSDEVLFHGETDPPRWGWLRWERVTAVPDSLYFTPCRTTAVGSK